MALSNKLKAMSKILKILTDFDPREQKAIIEFVVNELTEIVGGTNVASNLKALNEG